MSDIKSDSHQHSIKREPKFCKCRLCHEYFYAETIEQARQQCQSHLEKYHSDWQETGCYCPDY